MPYKYFLLRGESSHYLDRRKIPAILGWAGVSLLLFFLPLVFLSATTDALAHLTVLQLDGLRRGLPYPPNDDHLMVDTLLACACDISFACSAAALVVTLSGFFGALKRNT
jgi:hypothetical protein